MAPKGNIHLQLMAWSLGWPRHTPRRTYIRFYVGNCGHIRTGLRHFVPVYSTVHLPADLTPLVQSRRMSESAALLVYEILARLPIRQWVLSVPFPLRLFLPRAPQVTGLVTGLIHRTIAGYLATQSGCTSCRVQTKAVTLTQRVGFRFKTRLRSTAALREHSPPAVSAY